MSRAWHRHNLCDHPDTKYDREKCRDVQRHAHCDHEQTPTAARACEDMAKNHKECPHGSSFPERTACQNQQRKDARRAAKAE